MKRNFCLIFLLSLFPLFAQQNYQILQTTFLPREFYAGDVVELRVELQVPPGTALTVPEVLPDAGWFIVREIRIQHRGDIQEVRILFTSFQPGIRVIPGINLGGITLEGIRVDTSSILARGNPDFAPMADPLYLPRTAFFFAILLGSLIGLPLLFVAAGRNLGEAFQAWRTGRQRKRPYQQLVRELKELDRSILNRDGNLFYSRLLKAFKDYLSVRINMKLDARTSREVQGVLGGRFAGQPFLGKLEVLFDFGDQVKFGGKDPYTSRKKADLNLAGEALGEMEQYFKDMWIRQEKERKRARERAKKARARSKKEGRRVDR